MHVASLYVPADLSKGSVCPTGVMVTSCLAPHWKCVQIRLNVKPSGSDKLSAQVCSDFTVVLCNAAFMCAKLNTFQPWAVHSVEAICCDICDILSCASKLEADFCWTLNSCLRLFQWWSGPVLNVFIQFLHVEGWLWSQTWALAQHKTRKKSWRTFSETPP